MLLFEDDFGVDNSPADETQITTTILYFSEEELKQFKTDCKTGIKKMFGQEYQQKGNLSDFLLKAVKHYNETVNSQTSNDGTGSGSTKG